MKQNARTSGEVMGTPLVAAVVAAGSLNLVVSSETSATERFLLPEWVCL